MRKKLFITLFIATAFAGLSYVSAIADGGKGCEKKGDSCCAGIPSNLKLSKEQKAKVEDIQAECKKSKIKSAADIKAVRIDLNALLKKDAIDKSAVDAKVNEIGDLIKKALRDKTDCKVKILSILDAEQKKAYLESDDSCGERDHHECGMKGGPDCCKRGDDCCKKGEDCCKKEGKGGCDVKGKKAHDMKGMGSSEPLPFSRNIK